MSTSHNFRSTTAENGGYFYLPELTKSVYEAISMWEDRLTFSSTCQHIYAITLEHNTNLPWPCQPSDLHQCCNLPKKTARALELDSLILQTPTAVELMIPKIFDEFCHVHSLYISECEFLSKNVVRSFLDQVIMMNKAVKIYVPKCDKEFWTLLKESLQKRRAFKGVEIHSYVQQRIKDFGADEPLEIPGYGNGEAFNDDTLSDCHTEPGCASAYKVSKRKAIDQYTPPSTVKRQTKEFYESIMQIYIDMGFAQLKGHAINNLCKLPSGVVPLLGDDTTYEKFSAVIQDDALLEKRSNAETAVQNCIQYHAGRLVECVLMSHSSWVLITQFDVFLQNETDLDDCAMARKHPYYQQSKGFIISKTFQGTEWKEIVIRWGNMEFLALGGYCGQRNTHRRQAFLGSALPSRVTELLCLSETAFEIFTPETPTAAIQSARYLRSYAKSAASHSWSFISRRFIRNGFEACHALAVDRHQSRQNNKFKDRASIASLIVNIVVAKVYSKDDGVKCLDLLEKTKDFKEIPVRSWAAVETLSQACVLFKARVPNSDLLRPLELLCAFDEYSMLTDDPITRITASTRQKKTLLTEMFNTCLYPVIKKMQSGYH